MTRRLGGFERDGLFTVGNNTVADGVQMHPQPAGGLACGGVVGGTVAVDAAGLEQTIVLGEFVGAGL
jgi:hypothetical protein